MKNTITCRINYKYRIAVKPRNMVCFRYIIVSTLYKGEKITTTTSTTNNNNNNNNSYEFHHIIAICYQ